MAEQAVKTNSADWLFYDFALNDFA